MVYSKYLMSFEYHSILIYRIRGLFGGDFNLVV